MCILICLCDEPMQNEMRKRVFNDKMIDTILNDVLIDIDDIYRFPRSETCKINARL